MIDPFINCTSSSLGQGPTTLNLADIMAAIKKIEAAPPPVLRPGPGGGFMLREASHFSPDWTAISLPPFSRNRSPRQWKKLMRGVRLASYPRWSRVYVLNGIAYAHPTVCEAMKNQVAYGQNRGDRDFGYTR